MQPHLGAEQHPARRDGDDDRQEEQHAQALQTVLPPGEGPAVILLGAYQIHGGGQLAHDDLHQAHAEGGKRQARHVLVGPQGHGQEGIDQAHEHGKHQGGQDTQQHDQHRRQAGFADQVQHQAAARAAHAHDARNAKVQMPRFFGQDLARGAVNEGRAEGQGVDEKIQPGIHFTLLPPFPPCRGARGPGNAIHN